MRPVYNKVIYYDYCCCLPQQRNVISILMGSNFSLFVYRRGAGVQGPMGWSNVIQRQELHHSAPHEQLHIRKYCILKIELLSFSSVAHITSLIVIVKLQIQEIERSVRVRFKNSESYATIELIFCHDEQHDIPYFTTTICPNKAWYIT